MSSSFAAIVEEIKALSIPEKQELHELIERYLIEERREEIYQSYIHTLSEVEGNEAEFSTDTARLKEMLLND
jgi:hypothetical protein